MKTILYLSTLLLALNLCAASAPAVELRVELDQDIRPADEPATAVVKVGVRPAASLSSSRRQPLNLSIVLDRSGSMHGEKIEYARLAAIEALRRLGPDDIFSLVTYDSEIETVIPSGRVRDLEAAEAKIRRITPRGMTALYGGVNQGATEIRRQIEGRYVHRILLLSDGIANVGPSSPAELERLGRTLARENIAVTTIGVGLDYNEDLMTRLARASDGNTYFVEAARDLPRILSSELDDALGVYARNAVLRIEFDQNIRPVAVLGRQGQISGRVVEIPLHQLYEGRERFAMIEVELPARPAGTTATVATAEVVYERVGEKDRRSVRSEASAVRYSRDRGEVAGSVNVEVQEQVLEIRAAEARDRAVELADQGRREEAAAELRQASSFYRDSAARLRMPGLERASHALEAEADLVSERGIDNAQRKSYRAQNHQTVNQQPTR